MLRRLYHEQPESFAFTPANQAWAEAQVTKYPEGRQASAIIPLLWRAQEQEGWLTRPAIEHVAEMLGMAYIRALEVASFYFMFQLQPVGSVAHVQICGTTSCMICGAEDLIGVCKDKIAGAAHELSADGKFSWEEVECLGACANAPMAQIGKDYYEDLTAERLAEILDELASGKVPVPGPQNGRYTSEPKSGLTSLKDHEAGRHQYNASAQLATDIGDTVKRIDGTEVENRAPWQEGPAHGGKVAAVATELRSEGGAAPVAQPKPATAAPVADTGVADRAAEAVSSVKPESKAEVEASADATVAKAEKAATPEAAAETDVKAEKAATAKPVSSEDYDGDGIEEGLDEGIKPETLSAAREGGADNLKEIKGVGPKLEKMLNEMGFYHFDQVAKWTADEVAWVNANLAGFKGRVTRDNWVEQAKILAAGGETEFSKRVEDGDVY